MVSAAPCDTLEQTKMAAPMIKYGGPHCGQCCTLWQILEL